MCVCVRLYISTFCTIFYGITGKWKHGEEPWKDAAHAYQIAVLGIENYEGHNVLHEKIACNKNDCMHQWITSVNRHRRLSESS